ncbi:MAG TPA: glycosyltransferase family 39 protein [Anaerolineales bacterium]|nr:glycosyltransferase family 39 protein [Anaerolineales bacterium]
MISTVSSATTQKSNSTTISSRTQHLWILGIVLVLAGQMILLKIQSGDPREGLKQAIAGTLLILGAALFGSFVTFANTSPSRFNFPTGETMPSQFVWRETWILGSFLASIFLAALAIFLFVKFGESTVIILIWIASILFLFLATLKDVRIARLHLREDWIYPAALAGLLVIAAWTRLYKLTTLPYNFDGDFASVGLEARAILTGQYKHIFAFGWADIPILGYFPPYLTMKLFGDNLFGLNTSGVIEGLLVIVGVYLLGRDLFQPRVGLLAAALLTISYAHLAASREPTYIDPVLFLG